jgi:hypothetical protein
MRPAESTRANVTPYGLVILDLDKRRIFTANSVAAHIWQRLIIDNKNDAEIVDSIVAEHESAREVVERDLHNFVDRLKEQLIIID